jgi:YHS domain-containing protein
MKQLFISYLLVFACTSAFSQSTLRLKHFSLEKGVAIQGYDPVAYFTQSKAVKGNKSYSANLEGVTYYFSSAANKNLFLADSKKYEPQYGGWCAYAMGSSGEKVEIDPETFKVLNGKLYLFYNAWGTNTLTKWNKDEKNLHEKAEINWKKIYR